MAQVTIYMNELLEQQVKTLASSMNLSISKFIATTLEQKVDEQWDSSLKKLSGSWSDFPDLEVLRSNMSEDVKRETF